MTRRRLALDPTGQTTVLSDVLALIEEIRVKRQDHWRGRVHPEGKRFTQDEIRFGPCPTYHNLLSGRSQRLPARQTLLDIAEYLECTIAETNDILIAAQYLPERVELTTRQYQNAIERAKMLMNLLPLPSLIYGYQQEIVAVKESLLRLNDLPPLVQWDDHQRNAAHWFFDPSLPAHQFYMKSSRLCHQTAQGVAEFVYLLGKPYLREPAFQAQIERWRRLPEFESYWDAVVRSGVHMADGYGAMWMQTTYLDRPILKRNLLIPMSDNNEVMLGVGIPEDVGARHVFCQLEGRMRDIRWQDLLIDVIG
jgi:hypothetical protein